MNRASWVALGWAVGLGLPGCVVSSSSSTTLGADAASLNIDSVSATPSSVGDGESFEVAWRVTHTTKAGYITEMGLYTGKEADLGTASARDSRSLFSVATTSGAPNDASNSSMSCTRKGTVVTCKMTSDGFSSSRDIADATDFTFYACTSYVLASEETCRGQAVSLSFP